MLWMYINKVPIPLHIDSHWEAAVLPATLHVLTYVTWVRILVSIREITRAENEAVPQAILHTHTHHKGVLITTFLYYFSFPKLIKSYPEYVSYV